MNFLSGLAKGGDQPKPKADEHSTNPEDNKSYDKVAAGATADLIGAASGYGKLDETKGVGKYADQAETYLRDYAAPGAAAPEHKPADVKVAPPAEVHAAPPAAEVKAAEPTEAAAGGIGDYVKKAEGFLSKPSGEGESAEKAPEAGFGGDLMKKAGGFFK